MAFGLIYVEEWGKMFSYLKMVFMCHVVFDGMGIMIDFGMNSLGKFWALMRRCGVDFKDRMRGGEG